MKSRFEVYFPLFSGILGNPAMCAAVLLFCALPVALLSVHYSASFLCLAVSICLIASQGKFNNYLLLTPINILAFYLFTGSALGVALVTYARDGEFSYGLFVHQLVSAVTAIIAAVCMHTQTRRIPRFSFPLNNKNFEQDVLRPLIWLGWIFFTVAVLQSLVQAATGSSDRGYYGEDIAGGVIGPWTIFAIFPRLTNIGFFVLPLIFFRSTIIGKSIILGMFSVYMLLSFASGSRGAFIFPLVYIACGLYLFSISRAIKMDYLALLGFCVLAPLFVVVNEFRTSEAFNETRLIDLFDRLATLSERNALDHLKRESASEEVLGGRLITVHDSLVYEKTPRLIPHVGFRGLENAGWVWIPYFLAPNRPIQNDALFIALEYRGVKYNPRSHNRVGFNADLYRRFSWPGIVVGTVFFYLGFGFFYRKILDILLKKNALLGMILVLYTFSFFTRFPVSTVMETWWNWAYDFPKHLVLICFLYISLKWITKYHPKGLLSYRS